VANREGKGLLGTGAMELGRKTGMASQGRSLPGRKSCAIIIIPAFCWHADHKCMQGFFKL
jgi:hypothetical protein